ncbi:MAG: DUF3147 family protein [Rickettsiales bacterium]|nr:DUF3147 family protein [Rickettsiales bacterium]
MSYAVKIILTVFLVIASTETAKRFPAMGAAIITLPLTSMIAMCILYYDSQDAGKVAGFARSIPPVLLPSIIFFYAFSFLVEQNLSFVMAMLFATTLMLGGYAMCLFLLARIGS